MVPKVPCSAQPVDGNTCSIQNSKDATWTSVSCNNPYPYVCAIPAVTVGPTCPPCPTPAGCPTFPPIVGHCDSGWAYFDKTDSCYRYFLWATFDNAEMVCMSNGGHIASIHSDEENVFVADISKAGVEYKREDDLTWIGLQQANYPTSEQWTWTDGTELDYLHWGPSQPDDKKGREHCAQTHSDYLGRVPAKDNNYQHWDDCECTLSMRAYWQEKRADKRTTVSAMKLLLFVGLLQLVSAFTCPPNTIYHAEFNRCYKFSADTLPFYMAEESCQSLGGHLVSLQSGIENAMVVETAQQQKIGASFWIGLNQLNGNVWGYTDGSSVNYTNWQSANQSQSTAATCAVSTLPDGEWLQNPCSQSRPYVCAISTIVPVVTCPPCPTMECPAPPALAMSGNTYTDDADLTWIGLKQATFPDSKEWTWTDGSTVDFYLWAPTQPDDAGEQEHCVEIFSDHTGKDPSKDGNYQRWNDMPCAKNVRSYVCKKLSIH
ncbi:unnamed protein product [Heligmosomoides polygyrus]|uniref:C-type lectin domain-containing protein n=1 Tax=Heligmosomoides polygyrus TaxID=6339 RepID=A0A3P7ZD76_HELPZ|nr:unnamed protein product [Heligmosomoides polygyrus]